MAAALDGEYPSPVGEAGERLRAATHVLNSAPLWSLSESDVVAALEAVHAAEAELAAAKLRLVREADSRGVGISQGASSTAAWLRGRLRMRPGAAASQVRVAAALDPDGEFAASGAALGGGAICRDAATVIVQAVSALPASVPTQTRREGEAFLLEQALIYDPATLARLGKHLRHVCDPDGAVALAEAEGEAVLQRELFLGPDPVHPGMFALRGRLDDETAAALFAALDPLAAPRPSGPEGPDLRSAARRRADALAELVLGVLDGGRLPTQVASART